MKIRKAAAIVHRLSVDLGHWDRQCPINDIFNQLEQDIDEARIELAAQQSQYAFSMKLADIIINAMDLACYCGIDIERAIIERHAFNRNKPYRFGARRG